jgi:hypothetical protein
MELKRLNIASLIPGMQNVDIVGVASRVQKRSYSTEKGSGELTAVTLADQTGTIRLVLWGEEAEKLGDVAEGDVVRIQGYVRQGLYGPELRLGRFGKVEKAADRLGRRVRIADLQEGQKAEVRAALLQIFESNPFYEICPKCGATVKEDKDEYSCISHGKVEPDYALRVSGVIDDGSASLRVVFFKEQAERILGVSVKQAKDMVLRKGVPGLFAQAKFREWVFEGRSRHNKFFDRPEFIVDAVKEPDIRKEIEFLLSREERVKESEKALV